MSVLPTEHASTRVCEHPMCFACKTARATRRGSGTQTEKRKQELAIWRNDILLGDCVSTDQYESGHKGRTQKGVGTPKKENECYVGGTIFSEHASSFIWNSNQFSLRAGETLKSKENFENFLHDAGVTVKKYRADN